MQHRIGVGEAGVQGIRRRDCFRKQGRQARKNGPNAISRECRDLQPPLPDDRAYSRRRQTPVRIGVVIHFGDIDIGPAAGVVQGTPRDQRPTSIALD
jgi:hypothetical protein